MTEKPSTLNLQCTYQVLLYNQQAHTPEVGNEVHDAKNVKPKAVIFFRPTPGAKKPSTAVSGVILFQEYHTRRVELNPAPLCTPRMRQADNDARI